MRETNGEFIERIASSDKITAEDCAIMEEIMRPMFPQIRVVCGIVYLKGRGTLEAPPVPMQRFAQLFKEAYKKAVGEQ